MNNPFHTVFLHARDLSDPVARAAYLDHACAGDADDRARLEALLADQTAADAYFEELDTQEGPAPRPSRAALPAEQPVPEQIGPYRILERIGHGGMGDVYRAEQRQPIRREVALKLVKLGLDTRQVIVRFEAERQALAMMDHPNIARVFDAGADDMGRPYFVMELVRGEPITAYADRHLLPLKERLTLLQQVCHAVQHAHSKGIIHRDLKPGNILVSTRDGRPLAKVIDFGIAKATAAPLTDGTLFTEFHQFIGTPQYMSPEQAEGSLDIDTRSDVYSLGVLLYELLTGYTPFDVAKLKSAALAEIARYIREEEPPKPSTRLGTLAAARRDSPPSESTATLDTLAKSRALAPEALVRQVRGELDWLVMKSLEKDRNRRYETPNGLAEDIARYLDGQPILAAPPGAMYRVSKFVRKRKGPVIAGTLMVFALFLGVSGLVIGFKRANERADEMRRITGVAEEALQRIVSDGSPETHVVYVPESEYEKVGWGLNKGERPPLPEAARGKNVLYATVGAGLSREEGTVTMLSGWVTEKLDELRKTRTQAITERDAAQIEAYTGNLAAAQASLSNNDYPGARRRLDSCPEALRGWEWTFLKRRADSIMKIVRGYAKCFSGDGKLLAVLDGQKTLLLDENGNPVGRPVIHQQQVRELSFGHDERLLVEFSPNDGVFCGLLDRKGEFVELSLPHPSGGKWEDASFSPDRRTILTNGDGVACLWTMEGAAVGVPMKMNFKSFSPDGSRILGSIGDPDSFGESRNSWSLWNAGGQMVADLLKVGNGGTTGGRIPNCLKDR